MKLDRALALLRPAIGLILPATLASLALAQPTAPAQLPSGPLVLDERPSDSGRASRARSGQYKGRIFDLLAHADPGFPLDRVPAALDEADVAGAMLMPVPNEGLGRSDGTEHKQEAARLYPDRVRVMCGGDYLSNWLAGAQRLPLLEIGRESRMKRLRADLDGGLCQGVGELGMLHFNKLGHQNIITVRPDFEALLEVVDIAGQRSSWIQLHAEPREPDGLSHHAEVARALHAWFERQPRLRILLSHTGMLSASNARVLLQAYPNLYMSIKLMSARNTSWSHLEPVLAADGTLFEDWAQLFEEMPDRFVVGSDIKFGQAGHRGEESYEREILKFRRVLGSIDREAARAIAARNARRLFGFQNASDDKP